MNIDLASAFVKKKALITGGSGFIGSNLARPSGRPGRPGDRGR